VHELAQRSPRPELFVEVAARLTRTRELLIKLSTAHAGSAEFVASGAAAAMGRAIAARFPALKCFVLHVAPPHMPKAQKPAVAGSAQEEQQLDGETSESPGDYVPVLLVDGEPAATFVTDLTPNGVRVLVSADSFAEINPSVERDMFDTAVEFLGFTEAKSCEASGGDNVVVLPVFSGRDCNIQYLSHAAAYKALSPDATPILATQCCRAALDAQQMKLPVRFLNRPKAELGGAIFEEVAKQQALLSSASSTARGAAAAAPAAAAAAAAAAAYTAPVAVDLVVTAGRHGLHPQFLAEIGRHHAVIRQFLLTSCNVVSLAKDLHVLRETFAVVRCATFDFFPGTAFRMTILLLRPRRALRLVVLPIGAPGCCKSSSCRALQAAFEEDPFVPPASLTSNNQRRKYVAAIEDHNRNAPHQMSVKREQDDVSVLRFERDALFAALRGGGKSMSETKAAVHAALMAALRGEEASVAGGADAAAAAVAAPVRVAPTKRIVLIDSTNGSIEQRAEYVRVARNEAGASRTHVCVLEVFFDPARIAARVRARNDDEEADKKHDDDDDDSDTESRAQIVSALLARCLARRDHPAFPTDAEEARKKIELILSGIEPPRAADSSLVVEIDCSLPAAEIEHQFIWACFVALCCGEELARRVLVGSP
jgi:hypothetical protein